MLRDKTWGDQLVLYCFGRAVHTNVHLIMHGRVHTPRADDQEEEGDEVHVVYVRRNHYDAVWEAGQQDFASPDELDDIEGNLDQALDAAGVRIIQEDDGDEGKYVFIRAFTCAY
jgi:hypothetical protein